MLSIQERLGVKTEPVAGAAWQWSCALRSSIPAIVKSFDPVKQTVVAQPAIQEVVLLPPPATPQNPSPGSSQNIPTSVSIEPIQDVPIMMMRVPGWSITFPIVEGTECLLIFSDMCIDGWWQNSGVNAQFDRRRHDLSDAVALFGPWSQPNVLSDYSTDSVQIRSDDKSVMIDLTSGQITIQASAINILEDGGTPLAVVSKPFLDWVTASLLPALASHGITVTAPPITSLTTVLKAQ